MHVTSKSTPTDRLLRVLVATATVTLIAIAPALLASLFVHQDTANQTEPMEHAAAIDVTDIDQNGTVMYTASPSDSDRSDASIDFILPSDIGNIMHDGDLIKVTIEDRGTELTSDSFVDPEFEDGCVFTLRFSDEYRNDEPTETITGYVRTADVDTYVATYSADTKQQLNLCGIYFIDVDLPESSRFPNHP